MSLLLLRQGEAAIAGRGKRVPRANRNPRADARLPEPAGWREDPDRSGKISDGVWRAEYLRICVPAVRVRERGSKSTV